MPFGGWIRRPADAAALLLRVGVLRLVGTIRPAWPTLPGPGRPGPCPLRLGRQEPNGLPRLGRGVPVVRGSEDGVPVGGSRPGPRPATPAGLALKQHSRRQGPTPCVAAEPRHARRGRDPPQSAPAPASLRLRCVGPATLAATGRFQATGKWGRACAFVAVCA